MQSKIFLEIFTRDLLKLKEEISFYKNESNLWKINAEIKNPPGNLALHCIGSLGHFIGAILGNTGYIRQRDKEFSDKNVPREKIIAAIDETIYMLKKILSSLQDEDLMKDYPIEFLGQKRKTFFILTQSAVHINYHLGQINYHRRLITST